MSRIIAKHSHYVIEHVREVPKSMLYELSSYNPMYYRYDNIGFYHDKEKCELRIPRGYSEQTIRNKFPEHQFMLDMNGHNKYDKVEINLTAPPRDYMQQHILAYMIGKYPYEFTAPYSQLFVDLDTGTGKTYAGIASLCYYQCRGVIFTPAINSKIARQWVEAAKTFTTLSNKEILLVKGSQMCEDIIKGKYPDVKIFIVTRKTLLSFIQKYDDNWELVNELLKAMKVGMKIIDEAHMDFSTIMRLDMYSNVKRNYYMSSSPARSKIDEKGIYKAVFQYIPKYGKNLKTVQQNHIVPVIFNFRHEPSYAQIKAIKTKMGPSQQKYGDYLLDEKGAREEFIDAYLYAIWFMLRYRKNNGKLMVLCITKDFARDVAQVTKEIFPQYSIGLYIGSGKDKEKELDADIIFSTLQGFGTGSDMKNLQFVLNTVTYASEVLADQLPGRLRAIANTMTIYGELVNVAHQIAKKQYKDRESFLIKKAKNGKLIIHEVSNSGIMDMNKFLDKGYWYDGNGSIRTKDNKFVISKRKK